MILMMFLQKSYCCLNAKESRRTRVQYFTGSVLTPFQIIIVWWFLADTDRPKPKNGFIPKYRNGKPLSMDIWTGEGGCERQMLPKVKSGPIISETFSPIPLIWVQGSFLHSFATDFNLNFFTFQ